MNHDEHRNENEGNSRVRSTSETVDKSQATARENQPVNQRKQDQLDGEIDAPELKMALRLAPQATRRLPLRQIDARQDSHPSDRHHQPLLSDRIHNFSDRDDTKRRDFSRCIGGGQLGAARMKRRNVHVYEKPGL